MRGVLFDLDRTLVDVQSYTDYGAALEDVQRLVESWPDAETPETSWDRATRACMDVLFALSGDDRWQTVSDTIEAHELAALEHSRVMAGVDAALDTVGSLPRAVVTLLPPNAARAALDRHGIGIEVLVPRRPDLRPKPAPDQILEAGRLLDLPPRDLVMIGDSTWDRDAAVAAGAGFVGVTNGTPSEFPEGTEVIDNLGELGRIL